MKQKIEKIVKSSSIGNSLLLMIGTGISQFVPVLFSPLLARIYSPADFGDLAIFMAFSVIIGMCASGMYEYAIVLPEKENDAISIVKLITIISLFISFLCGIIFIILSFYIKIEEFYYLVPFSIFFTTCYNILSYWYNRTQKYKILNIVRILQSVIIVAGSFMFYSYKNGLIYGFVLGGLFCCIMYLLNFLIHFRKINLKEIKRVAIVYKKFPTLILPSSLMNTVSGYAPVFFIKKFYTSSQLGSYSMSNRVLTAPISVISTAIGQVYFKNLSDYYNEEKDELIKKTFQNSTYVLSFISIVIFLPLFFFGENLAIFVFGKAWKEAGEFIEIIALASMIKFIVSPLSTILIVKKELNKVAKWQTIYFFTSMTIFIIGSFFSIKTLLWIYVVHETILYGIYYYIMKNMIDRN
ncbi:MULTISPECIES: oligosaccharide flippase family protein [Chryseobacterium]|uniref:O-antigen/teichoic acid export membrane protein n=1 Tax=Chryseobacterium geocarposphaerae TaxID=1416776 RepID=A0ABU1LDR3_9FLAO|nr:MULTISPECIES: oligosaccharide flippase family protein [Chryseobacterium]MDR6404750.1 O-antigen/teichoic acid export membrane protein [Chryseobacterium geocarposphaerae]MDR6698017.1 O-antigen/teichoic acid export membrane protein [Chryseobacterium ginsenosidimutans]